MVSKVERTTIVGIHFKLLLSIILNDVSSMYNRNQM